MNADFSRIISLLRREKHISQKQAATELGISQALLSHYEKGIRECGLDFVVKVSDYYQVSCDYLLGRSADRSGLMLTAAELPDSDSAGKELAVGSTGLLPMLNKKLLANSINILYDLLAKMKCRALTQEVSAFMMLALYRMFRAVYSVNAKNPQALFSANKMLYSGYADAAMRIAEANACAIAAGEGNNIPHATPAEDPIPLPLDSKSIASSYPLFASSLFNLVKNAEEHMVKSIKKE